MDNAVYYADGTVAHLPPVERYEPIAPALDVLERAVVEAVINALPAVLPRSIRIAGDALLAFRAQQATT